MCQIVQLVLMINAVLTEEIFLQNALGHRCGTVALVALFDDDRHGNLGIIGRGVADKAGINQAIAALRGAGLARHHDIHAVHAPGLTAGAAPCAVAGAASVAIIVAAAGHALLDGRPGAVISLYGLHHGGLRLVQHIFHIVVPYFIHQVYLHPLAAAGQGGGIACHL